MLQPLGKRTRFERQALMAGRVHRCGRAAWPDTPAMRTSSSDRPVLGPPARCCRSACRCAVPPRSPLRPGRPTIGQRGFRPGHPDDGPCTRPVPVPARVPKITGALMRSVPAGESCWCCACASVSPPGAGSPCSARSSPRRTVSCAGAGWYGSTACMPSRASNARRCLPAIVAEISIAAAAALRLPLSTIST